MQVCFSGDHVSVRLINVEGRLKDSLADFEHGVVIEKVGEVLVRIEDDEGGADVSEDEVLLVPFDQVVEYFGLVEDGHVAHVFEELAFRGDVEGVGERDCNLCSAGFSLYFVQNFVIVHGSDGLAF
jgi:hypothetical protein